MMIYSKSESTCDCESVTCDDSAAMRVYRALPLFFYFLLEGITAYSFSQLVGRV